MYEILYVSEVVKIDLPYIQEPWKSEIKHAVESKLMTRPEIFSKPLRRSLKGYRKLRVGGYRIIFRIDGDTVKIFIIQHRSTVYENASERL